MELQPDPPRWEVHPSQCCCLSPAADSPQKCEFWFITSAWRAAGAAQRAGGKHKVIEVFIKAGRKFICYSCFFSSQSSPGGEEEWAACAGNRQESVFCPFVSLMNKKNTGRPGEGEMERLEEAGTRLSRDQEQPQVHGEASLEPPGAGGIVPPRAWGP